MGSLSLRAPRGPMGHRPPPLRRWALPAGDISGGRVPPADRSL